MKRIKKDKLVELEKILRHVDFNIKDLRVRLNLTDTKISWRISDVEKHLDLFEKKMERRFDKVMQHIDGLAGGFKKFDEERLIMSDHLGDHGDRIEKLENVVFKTS